jgi:carboxypeptidase D
VQLPTLHQDQVEEETIPLTRRGENDGEDDDEGTMQQRKGKERLREPEPEPELAESPTIFNVGDSEDEEEYKRIASAK